MYCHGNNFLKGHLGKNYSFLEKNGIFYQNVFISNFLTLIRNQRLRIDPCAKFQLNWTKDKRTHILTWDDTKNGLMTSYLPPSDDISNILCHLRDFVPEYHHAKFGCNWATNKGETMCPPPAYMVPKDPSLNRVEVTPTTFWIKCKNLHKYKKVFVHL